MGKTRLFGFDLDSVVDSAKERARRSLTRDGGLYACLKTAACGSMKGMLDILYRWLSRTNDYEPDEQRQAPTKLQDVASYLRKSRDEMEGTEE